MGPPEFLELSMRRDEDTIGREGGPEEGKSTGTCRILAGFGNNGRSNSIKDGQTKQDHTAQFYIL